MSQIEKPEPDSQYRLCPCKGCKSEEVGYVAHITAHWPEYCVKCLNCGKRTPWFRVRHDAQLDWNRRFGEGFRYFSWPSKMHYR